MSETARTNEIYINIEQTTLATSDGGNPTLGEPFILHRNSRTIVRAHLRLDDESPFTPVSGASWFFGLDNSYDPTSEDPVFTLTDDFNKSEYWGDLDVDNGKIAWRINCATTALATKFSSATPANPAKLPNTVGELWMTAPGESAVLLCQWDITMRNIVTEIAADTTLEYLSSNIVTQESNGDVVLWYADGTEADRWSKT